VLVLILLMRAVLAVWGVYCGNW